ncbi:MAG: hypothetical protein HDS87_08735 [Bacteroidales bacterium]|nr:hypothetical protein [Bacteroidales bacterium]
MNATPLNNQPSGNGNGTKWTRASIAAAAVAGALTAEGPNLLYAQLTPESEPELQPAYNPNSSHSSSHTHSHTPEHLSLL